jgi:uncharacterized membrane protein
MSKDIHNYCCSTSWWGVFLILIGVYLIAKQQGWITSDIPFWPVVAIVVGVYLLAKGSQSK